MFGLPVAMHGDKCAINKLLTVYTWYKCEIKCEKGNVVHQLDTDAGTSRCYLSRQINIQPYQLCFLSASQAPGSKTALCSIFGLWEGSGDAMVSYQVCIALPTYLYVPAYLPTFIHPSIHP